ncbi:unnamed protein product [Cuscuta campestris]|uniref:Uncharacterized protein n=1 Tax=Cuscuta campestris TaxID=132261 RepID=A0A484MXM2_9ASTE|nr:unnamed protein product [Cuscuta campestris]
MMNAIRNLLGAPLAPVDMAPTTILHNPTSCSMEFVEHIIVDSMSVSEVDDNDVSVEAVVHAFPSDLIAVDTPVAALGDGEDVKAQTLSNVIIAYSSMPLSKTAQVVDANFVQADNSQSLDIIENPGHANIIEFGYRILPRVVMIMSSSDQNLWINIFSPVQKHEWEPPP